MKQQLRSILKKGLFILSFALCSMHTLQAQEVRDSIEMERINQAMAEADIANLPIISYNTTKTYEIADLKVSGIKNPMYEDYVIIGFSELSVGDKIEIPGEEISGAIKRFWKNGLFSEVKIVAAKVEGNKIWLEIILKERPRISDILFTGIKKGEQKDLEQKTGLRKNLQVSPSQIDKSKSIIKKYFEEKGFNKAEINIAQTPDVSKENQVILTVNVLKKNKTSVDRIIIEGNTGVKTKTLEKAMKKTRHKSTIQSAIQNFLRSTKYLPEGYANDKELLIEKYNEFGYRDAVIAWDSVYTSEKNPNKVTIAIKIDEGKKYIIREIKWIGNTEYATQDLQMALNMKPGDVYNQKKLSERLMVDGDEDAVMNYFYQNHGYIFSHADPVEVNIENDSVDLEIRISEGSKATLRRVSISGNDRLYEDIVRRELRLKPGALYSREDIMQSLREIAQIGHFDPENLKPDILPDEETGTVDIALPLVSKANDQVEFSAGYGQTGIIGKLSLKFTNFSLTNLLNPKAYKGLIPQGEGQTLTLSAQTNAQYYQSYSVSFMDPWFGGKRPNSLTVGAYYSKQTDINSNYLSQNTSYSSYNTYGSQYSGSQYNNGGGDYTFALDPNKSMQMLGFSAGYGKRLTWPDYNFFVQAELAYQRYTMKDWAYFIVKDGTSNSVSLNLSIKRYSVDQPTYPRRGTDFSLSMQVTPPFSLWDGKDYAAMKSTDGYYEPAEKFKWIEYHKWKFKSKTFTPLSNAKKTPVLMARVEYGLVGYYDKNKRSPFETFDVGGDGMSGYSSNYATETIALRGYKNGTVGRQASAYSRLALELRYPLILEPSSTIYILGFAEAGNAWGNLKDFNPFSLKRSAGVGARIMLPMIGLMGIDWAYGFDPINGTRDNSGSQLHFIIGQEF